MRTTVRLKDDLLMAAKSRAAAERTTLTALIEDSLRQRLAQGPSVGAQRFELHPFGDARTRVGVDLDDSAALRDVMDGLR
jgi:hypothetical protein